jgi:hypothetical protein
MGLGMEEKKKEEGEAEENGQLGMESLITQYEVKW